MKRELERIEIPGEHEARERAWAVALAAYAEHEPRRRSVLGWRPLVAVAAAAALVAAVLSPPGEALLDAVRDAIGVEGAAVALVALPADGLLLVDSRPGPWIVRPDGSKRLLGPYRGASWSPNGRFVVATGSGESGTRQLFALEPHGRVRWSLARPAHIRFPRWSGTAVDTRIAYLAGDVLRVVAGDGTGDRPLAVGVAPVAPAWHPRERHVLAAVAHDARVDVYEADSGRALRRLRAPDGARAIAWSADGRLAVVGRERVVVFAPEGSRPQTVAGAGALDAAFAPDGRLAVLFADRVAVGGETVFAGPGLRGLAWSPDGRWLLISWKEANQWIFVRTKGERAVRAVANVSEQFGGSFPRLSGWCCS